MIFSTRDGSGSVTEIPESGRRQFSSLHRRERVRQEQQIDEHSGASKDICVSHLDHRRIHPGLTHRPSVPVKWVGSRQAVRDAVRPLAVCVTGGAMTALLVDATP